jgi:hypothetical protein
VYACGQTSRRKSVSLAHKKVLVPIVATACIELRVRMLTTPAATNASRISATSADPIFAAIEVHRAAYGDLSRALAVLGKLPPPNFKWILPVVNAQATRCLELYRSAAAACVCSSRNRAGRPEEYHRVLSITIRPHVLRRRGTISTPTSKCQGLDRDLYDTDHSRMERESRVLLLQPRSAYKALIPRSLESSPAQ